jgi:hypothetical protein
MPYIIDNITANTINVKDTLLINGVPVSGGGGLDDITYSDLYNKTVNGELEPGKWYRLTDYKSVNFLNGWEIADNNPTPTDPNFNPQEIYEGETEVLILQATSPYEISEIGYSETFNGDIVQYEPFINKIGVDLDMTNGDTLPDSSTVSGFDLQWDGTNVYFNMPTGYPALFGHYFYLYCEFDGGSYYQDGAFDPLTPGISVCQYPYTSDDPDYGYPKAVSRIRVEDDGMKIVLIDLTEQDYLNYDVDTLYVDTVYALGDAYGWITRRQDTFRNIDVPFDFRGRKYRRFEVDLSVVNPALGTGYWGQGDNYLNQGTTGNFIDVPSFGQDGYDAFTIKWTDMGGPDMYWYRGYNDNNVCLGYFKGNVINPLSYNNTLSAFFDNTVGSNFLSNTLGDNFHYNTVGSVFLNNTVGSNFKSNTVGDSFAFNKINVNFQGNMVGDNFQSNTVGSVFLNNTVGSNFNNNTLGNNFSNNTVGSVFLNNTVGNGFNRNQIDYSLTSTNFTSATHVYGDYTCNIFKRSNNTFQLSYIDGSNVIQYTAITA